MPLNKNPLNFESLKGFTLVELSIVLVIIGLLVSGILTGQELIQAAKRNAVISDITNYRIAVNTFALQYNGALPGDFDEATEYWPTECFDQNFSNCNGNSNGKITHFISGTDYRENFRAWQHLQLAEIISGEFTGYQDVLASATAKIGYNVPGGGMGRWVFI